jgi:hypothetical protein
MTNPLDPATLVQPALDSVKSGLGGVAGPALLIGGSVLAISVGWRFARRFVSA